MVQTQIYLDFNATAPVLPAVVDAVTHALSVTGNPSSVHQHGREARHLVQMARQNVAAAVDTSPENVIFTSGGTESNNVALRSATSAADGTEMLVASTEHDSVLATAGGRTPLLPVQQNGLLDLQVLDERLAALAGRAVVSTMLANNETGIIQPIPAIAEIVHAHDGLLHCDAVQAVGKIPVSFPDLGADSMAITAHKFGGPKGVGALVLRSGLDFEPEIIGGGQEEGRRSGTENVASIAGFGAAAALVPELLSHASRLASMRDDLQSQLKETASPVYVAGEDVDRLPNTLSVTMPGVPGDTQVMSFDLEGISISSGAACSSGKVSISHVLAAMGIDPEVAKCAVRISLGPSTQDQHIEKFLSIWMQLSNRLKAA